MQKTVSSRSFIQIVIYRLSLDLFPTCAHAPFAHTLTLTLSHSSLGLHKVLAGGGADRPTFSQLN